MNSVVPYVPRSYSVDDARRRYAGRPVSTAGALTPWAVTFPNQSSRMQALALQSSALQSSALACPSSLASPNSLSAFDGPPPPPPNLLDGIPTPARVEQQKLEFAAGIDNMLNTQTALLAQRHQAVLDFLRAKNDQQKRHACAAVEQQRMKGELDLQMRYGEQMMQLAQAANRRKLELDKQANAMVMEYQARKAQEELSAQDYEVHRRFFQQSAQPLPLPAAGIGTSFGNVGLPPPSGDLRPPDYSSISMPPGGNLQQQAATTNGATSSSTAPAATSTSTAPAGPTSNRDAIATLYLVVHGCYHLINKDTGILGDVSDPFVLARVGKKEEKTPTINNDLNPVWTDKNRFKFNVGPRDSMLELEVWNSNIFKNDSLGRHAVDLRTMPTGSWLRKKERLTDGGEGDVEFDMRLEAHPGATGNAHPQAGGMPYPQLSFGPLGLDGKPGPGMGLSNNLPFNN